jgi:hypothetical protein
MCSNYVRELRTEATRGKRCQEPFPAACTDFFSRRKLFSSANRIGVIAMWVVWLLGFLLFTAPASAEPGFSEKYERDYNIFNPI